MNKAKILAIAIIALFAGASLSHAGFGDLADMAKKKAAEEAKKQALKAGGDALKAGAKALFEEEDEDEAPQRQYRAKDSGKPALKECDAIFNPKKKFCYDGGVYDLCDDMSYNPTTHICSDDIANRALCNGAQYNPLRQKCENNAILTVCGAISYDQATHGCKNNTLFALPKCGAISYDPEAKFCDSRDGRIYKFVVINTQTWMAENLNYNVGGSKCYDNKPANCDKYGRLYNWSTALNICPKGWHLPNNAEWEIFMGSSMYGFSALPGGFGLSAGNFSDVGSYGYWWSASEYDSYYAYSMYMGYDKYADLNYDSKRLLFSIRCLRD